MSNIQEPTPASAEGDTPEIESANPNAEAAKYRRKLRDTESALETAEGRVNALLRREAEGVAGKTLAVGADLFEIGGVAIDDLTDPEGNVMPDAVEAAVEALLAKRPGLRNADAGWGAVSGGRYDDDEAPRRASMRDVLREARNSR
ncbi:hypothetical protein ABZ622_13905 [Streptomyces sp. NPDC007164]|uniref:hypothetical protein n=1 Tax=Streptomyces sp. NPDC007164 TaxID=3156918 RepID=UPI0033F6C0F2